MHKRVALSFKINKFKKRAKYNQKNKQINKKRTEKNCVINQIVVSFTFFQTFRWNEYKRVGKQILGTRFIAFKVPLTEVSNFNSFSHAILMDLFDFDELLFTLFNRKQMNIVMCRKNISK